jgi:hypothetical protein
LLFFEDLKLMKSGQINFLVNIKERSIIARIAAWKLKSDNAAIVLGKTIHLHNTTYAQFLQNKTWVCHELKHIQQFRQHGFVSFIILYLWESLLHGYSSNKYEIEARKAENDESLLKIFKIADSRNTDHERH